MDKLQILSVILFYFSKDNTLNLAKFELNLKAYLRRVEIELS